MHTNLICTAWLLNRRSCKHEYFLQQDAPDSLELADQTKDYIDRYCNIMYFSHTVTVWNTSHHISRAACAQSINYQTSISRENPKERLQCARTLKKCRRHQLHTVTFTTSHCTRKMRRKLCKVLLCLCRAFTSVENCFWRYLLQLIYSYIELVVKTLLYYRKFPCSILWRDSQSYSISLFSDHLSLGSEVKVRISSDNEKRQTNYK